MREMKFGVAEYEKLIEVVERLRERSLDFPTVVEGKRDEAALRGLGLEGEIVKVKAGKALYELCEELGNRYSEVVLMTDTDKEGEKIARELKKRLSQYGTRVNDEFRNRLLTMLDTNEVENLDRRLEKKIASFKPHFLDNLK